MGIEIESICWFTVIYIILGPVCIRTNCEGNFFIMLSLNRKNKERIIQ